MVFFIKRFDYIWFFYFNRPFHLVSVSYKLNTLVSNIWELTFAEWRARSPLHLLYMLRFSVPTFYGIMTGTYFNTLFIGVFLITVESQIVPLRHKQQLTFLNPKSAKFSHKMTFLPFNRLKNLSKSFIIVQLIVWNRLFIGNVVNNITYIQ